MRAEATPQHPSTWPSDWLVADWPAPPDVRALVTTRRGGVSPGVYASFNLAAHVGDDPAAVAANRASLRRHLPTDPVWMTQVHGVRVIDPATVGASGHLTLEADAACTGAAGVPCAVLTADCLPILLCDGGVRSTRNTATSVGAVHAGWRGLADGVIEAALAALQTPPERVLAWIGPCIGANAFECGVDVVDAMTREHVRAMDAFRQHPTRPGKWLGDLPAIARQRLTALGVPEHAIYGGTWCTVADPLRFFSFRRDGVTGRMASLIWRTA